MHPICRIPHRYLLTRYSLCLSLIAALLLTASCSGSEKPDAPPEVGMEYLQSESYRTFQRNLRIEQQQADRERELIGLIIRRIEERTEREMELPAVFNTEEISRFTDPEKRILLRETAVTGSPYGRYSYYPVGSVSRGEITILFFILRRNETPYVDTDLMMAGMGPEGEVRNVQAIAPFRKKYGLVTESKVTVREDLSVTACIETRMERPLPDRRREQYEYRLSADGRINVDGGERSPDCFPL